MAGVTASTQAIWPCRRARKAGSCHSARAGHASAAAAALLPAELANRIRAALQALHREAGGSAQSPSRALVLAEPPSSEAGEITDKGYLNQRAVLNRRAADVAALYAGIDPRVIAV